MEKTKKELINYKVNLFNKTTLIYNTKALYKNRASCVRMARILTKKHNATHFTVEEKTGKTWLTVVTEDAK